MRSDRAQNMREQNSKLENEGHSSIKENICK